ncbi:PaaI family thioesterase [Pectobacteriaceae bacterium CE70]|uniref:PaaI family thioesterase n=1 Tax=Brenneria uluponensis TaxID=3057057 RepID=UPI0028E5EBF6|nr:PaaI family thioesterase [Brenneria ulupoensis]WJV65484.1 PaaI family thioesterase [Pectobacteriaceae bacterium CE70]WJY09504.1 PaaI family thioesterase [Pectobacteriaceae bacterium C80]
MVCGSRENNPDSLELVFSQHLDGSVSAPFMVSSQHQGYTGLLHGGMTSTLLDAAMTHCLFMQGITALTAELTVRFMAPIRVSQALTVCARLLGQRRGIYQLEAWLVSGPHIAGQNIATDQRLARASAKFIAPTAGSMAHGY